MSRYTKVETTYLTGRLPTGNVALIEIYDLSDASAVPLDSATCTEIGTTGLYVWPSSDMTTTPTGHKQYVYTMIDQTTNDRYDGKSILNDPDIVVQDQRIKLTWIESL